MTHDVPRRERLDWIEEEARRSAELTVQAPLQYLSMDRPAHWTGYFMQAYLDLLATVLGKDEARRVEDEHKAATERARKLRSGLTGPLACENCGRTEGPFRRCTGKPSHLICEDCAVPSRPVMDHSGFSPSGPYRPTSLENH